MAYASIDSAGTNGIWTKHLLKRVGFHAKVLERTLRSLETKGRIVSMAHVKHPQRKMFIVAGLQPSESATGGAWYTGKELDKPLIDLVTFAIEEFVSRRSWVEVADQPPPLTSGNSNKRKTPHDGFDVKGKGRAKVARIDDNQPRSESPEHIRKSKHIKRAPRSYVPQSPGFRGYPTLADITRHINTTKYANSNSVFPQTAILELLNIMVYDDKLFTMTRPMRDDEIPDEGSEDTITMYRCFKSPAERAKTVELAVLAESDNDTTRRANRRVFELEEIGRGGVSEIPCQRCPAFEICGDGGPVNVVSCPYYDEWYLKACKADEEVDPWPSEKDFTLAGQAKKRKRLALLPPNPTKDKDEVKKEGEVVVLDN
jgi:DNA-directed RNA polymerase III subunit RPC6